MRVAVVAEWYPSPADPVHGVWAHRQAVASVQAGAEVRVLALRRPVPPLSVARRLGRGEFDALGTWVAGARAERRDWQMDGLGVSPVHWLGPPRPVSYGAWGMWMAPALHRALDRLARSWPFDLVHAHNLAPTGQAAAVWTRRRGVPLVVSAHGPDMLDVPFRSPLGRRAVTRSLTQADLVLANSTWTRGRCLELAAGGAVAVETVHLGADLAAVDRESAGDGALPSSVPNGPLRLVTVAHLQARKHHATVLSALAAFAPERRPRYLIIGDGEEREPLARRAAELGVGEWVSFCGQLPHEEALARLGGCDVFVMPGVDEPFGVAFIEAMAAGLVAIGGRGEGGPEDITGAGPGMIVVRPGDAEELAGVLTRLDGDREQLAHLGAAARHTVAAHFTWEICGERTVAAYAAVLAARRGPGDRAARSPVTAGGGPR